MFVSRIKKSIIDFNCVDYDGCLDQFFILTTIQVVKLFLRLFSVLLNALKRV